MQTDLMKRLLSRLLVLPLIILGLRAAETAPPSAPGTPAEIPVEYFFRPPSIRGAALNPAGTHVAMMVADQKRDSTGLMIVNLADNTIGGLRGDTTYDVSAYAWAGDDRVVFSLARDNLYAWGLYAMKRDDSRSIVTLNEHDVVEVLGSPRARPDNLFVWVRRSARDEGRPGRLLELDLRKNSRDHFGHDGINIRGSIAPPPKTEGVLRWWRDREGEIRYALAYQKAQTQLFRRETDGLWTPLALDVERDRPMAVDADAKTLLVAHRNESGACELRRLNTTDGTLSPVLQSDDKYDFSDGGIRISADDREVIGLIYARQAPEQVWIRAEEAALQRELDGALPPDRLNLITSRSRDGQRLLITSSSDRHPGSLYLFDRTTRKLRQLAELASWLPERLMAPVRLMTFKARDGLKLDAYVTLPLGYDPQRPAPMIVLPHGGPWARDVWGYEAVSQFFASRGYIVFRPNYRGSTGYNAEISLTPRMEFRKMHEDVTDGVRALITSKIADPAHIAIVGGSFGGYLAVCGAAFDPGLYRCAVSIAGIFDWERVLREERINNPESFRYESMRRALGDPKVNQDKFEAMSPYLHAASIRIPVFVAHGKADTNADTSQSRRLVKALAKAGVPHEAFFVPDEGHSFGALKDRVELFTRIESFLKKHL